MKIRSIIVVLLLGGLVGTVWVFLPLSPPPTTQVTVVRGDTLGQIAKRFGISVDALRQENGIRGDLIEVGDVLRIPVDAVIPTSKKGRARAVPRHPSNISPSSKNSPPKTLVMPVPKPCHSGPSDDVDTGMAASEGLSIPQIQVSMSAFLPFLTRCVTDTVPQNRLLVELVVGCDGRVADIGVDDDPGWPIEVSECVLDTLSYAEFPAHALPDGDYFRYPVSFVAQSVDDGLE